MRQRFVTGIVLMAIFIPLLVVDKMFNLFQILLMALVFISSLEMIKLFSKDKKFPGISKILIILCTILLYLSALAQWNPGSQAGEVLKLFNINIGFFSMLLLITVVIFSMLVAYDEYDGNVIGHALTTIMYCGLGFAALTILRFIGLRFIAYLFIITIFTDVFAYLFGMKFGKHKMSPKISPKKSWEGAIGGTLMATVFGVGFAFFYGKIFGDSSLPTIFHGIEEYFTFSKFSTVVQFIIIFAITVSASIIGQIGDLVASKFKRTYEIKDFGNIFPGHGGVLDRLDSAIFVAIFLLSIISLMQNILV